jgi:hypothetical protein
MRTRERSIRCCWSASRRSATLNNECDGRSVAAQLRARVSNLTTQFMMPRAPPPWGALCHPGALMQSAAACTFAAAENGCSDWRRPCSRRSLSLRTCLRCDSRCARSSRRMRSIAMRILAQERADGIAVEFGARPTAWVAPMKNLMNPIWKPVEFLGVNYFTFSPAATKWWLWVGSNHRPRHYECRALTG